MNWFSRVKRLLPSGNSHTWEKTLLTLRIAQEKSHMRKDLFGSVPVRKNIIRMKSIMKTKIGMVHRIRLCESLNSVLSSILRNLEPFVNFFAGRTLGKETKIRAVVQRVNFEAI